MRIDAHIHFTPPSLKARLESLADSEPYWSLLLNPPKGKSIQGWVSADTLLHDMDAAGIDKVVIVGEYFRQHENCIIRNNQALDLINKWPDRLMAMATIQPNAGQAAVDELHRCLDGGMIGMGELNPYAQGFRLDDKNFLMLCTSCIERDAPINLHVSEEIGGYYLGKSTTPLRDYYELACRLPDLKLVLAHWGGGLCLYEIMPRVRRQLRNVWYDTAATPLLYPTEKIFELGLAAIDHRKLLHGSDYPLMIYPRTMKEASFEPFLGITESILTDETVREDVMGRNAARLFGLLDDGVDHRREIKKSKRKQVDLQAITPSMSVRSVVEVWPESADIFANFNIPTLDTPVPAWEPIMQAAAGQGLTRDQQAELLEALNKILSSE